MEHLADEVSAEENALATVCLTVGNVQGKPRHRRVQQCRDDDNFNCALMDNDYHICSIASPITTRYCSRHCGLCTREEYDTGRSLSVRLGGLILPDSGRVEVKNGGHWGTGCSDSWSHREAEVVCRMIGLPWEGAQTVDPAFFGPGIGPVLLDDVRCNGEETSLLDCYHSGWGQSNCTHDKDVAVVCQDRPTNIHVRLAGGTATSNGRLEVYSVQTKRWGTVCRNSFRDREAGTVCKMLGFDRYGSELVPPSTYGPGTGPVLLQNVRCNYQEVNLGYCSHNGWYITSCPRSQVVGIVCRLGTPHLRLTGGRVPTEGRLEVELSGIWGTVCSYGFTNLSARIICRQLGYPSSGAAVVAGSHYRNTTGTIWTLGGNCQGTEMSFFDCPRNQMVNVTCSHSQDVVIACTRSTLKDLLTARLVGGPTPLEGTLEVYHQGVWGTVCGGAFGAQEAAVACRMLGFSRYNAKPRRHAYAAGSGQIWLGPVYCLGNETNLSDCMYKELGQISCLHYNDNGVACLPAVRLVNGSSTTEGRLEVFYDGVWGTVCDDYFDVKDARVVCRMLGMDTSAPIFYPAAHYGKGAGMIWMDDVKCLGTETYLYNCPFIGFGHHNCQHTEDVGVSCPPGSASHVIG